jgi:hypothetical protein
MIYQQLTEAPLRAVLHACVRRAHRDLLCRGAHGNRRSRMGASAAPRRKPLRAATRRVRRPLIFNVHWSAVIRERRIGRRFAVDSWFLDNGHPPFVQPLEDWLSGQGHE